MYFIVLSNVITSVSYRLTSNEGMISALVMYMQILLTEIRSSMKWAVFVHVIVS